MYKKTSTHKNTILYTAIAFAVLSTASCSLKNKLTKTKDLQTKSLFMQSKQATIELPNVDSNGSAVVSESVTIKNADNWLENQPQSTKKKGTGKIDEVQHLDELVVTTRLRLTPEQEGRVNVDFLMKVPKELLSPVWRVTLKPIILHNDSVVPLDDVVLKGSDFLAMQKRDYQAYDDYIASIIDSSKYDSVFLDKKGIDQDIKNIQNFHYSEYYAIWKKQQDYEIERAEWEQTNKFFSDKQVAYKKEMYHKYSRKALEESIKKYSQGKDTTGIHAHYMKQYEKDTKYMLSHWQKRVDKLDKNTPQNEVNFTSLKDVPNNVFSGDDSLRVTKNRYQFADIAYNELKLERKDEFREKTIKYPFEENTRIDTLADVTSDFVYLYKQSYPVSPGLKKLQITMSGRIDAIDQSSYTMGKVDTLSYFITSLADLADTTHIYKVSKLDRDVFNRVIAYVKFPTNKTNFDINYRDNKDEIEKVLHTYRTFKNTGVYSIDSVFIKVSTSLDGSFDQNISLSEKRSHAIKNYLKGEIGNEIDVESVFRTEHVSEDWNTLVREIKKRNDIKNKDEILNILTSATFPDATEDQIKKTYKADFTIIRDSIYPLLNKAEVTFNMHRTDMTEASEVRREYRDGYEEGLRLLQEREYWKALEILAQYPDFNAALCLTGLGYNAKAYELLLDLPKTGNNEYLLAILSERMDKGQEEVVEHLMESFKLDPTKIYRAPLDSEVAQIIKKYDLQNRIDALSSAPIEMDEDGNVL